jgi:hypothetical protein
MMRIAVYYLMYLFQSKAFAAVSIGIGESLKISTCLPSGPAFASPCFPITEDLKGKRDMPQALS